VRKFLRLLLVASVLYGAGAHWAALQSAAWAGMLATRVSESSWAEAVSSTFSGEKPCSLCRIVDKGSSSEQGPALLGFAPSLDLALSVFPRLRVVPPVRASAVSPLPSSGSLSFRPAVPPPKTLLPA